MSRLARRNKVRWHKQMKKRGFVWFKRVFWKRFKWQMKIATRDDGLMQLGWEVQM